MQSVFMDNWMPATGRVLYRDDYFPSLQAVGVCATCYRRFMGTSNCPRLPSQRTRLLQLFRVGLYKRVVNWR